MPLADYFDKVAIIADVKESHPVASVFYGTKPKGYERKERIYGFFAYLAMFALAIQTFALEINDSPAFSAAWFEATILGTITGKLITYVFYIWPVRKILEKENPTKCQQKFALVWGGIIILGGFAFLIEYSTCSSGDCYIAATFKSDGAYFYNETIIDSESSIYRWPMFNKTEDSMCLYFSALDLDLDWAPSITSAETEYWMFPYHPDLTEQPTWWDKCEMLNPSVSTGQSGCTCLSRTLSQSFVLISWLTAVANDWVISIGTSIALVMYQKKFPKKNKVKDAPTTDVKESNPPQQQVNSPQQQQFTPPQQHGNPLQPIQVMQGSPQPVYAQQTMQGYPQFVYTQQPIQIMQGYPTQ